MKRIFQCLTVRDATLILEAEMPAFISVLLTACAMAEDAFAFPAAMPGRFRMAVKVDISAGACKSRATQSALLRMWKPDEMV